MRYLLKFVSLALPLVLLPLLIITADLSANVPEEPPSEGGGSGTETLGSAPGDIPGAIHYVKVDGVVNPVMSEFLLGAIGEAERSGSSVVVIEIDTPGGLDLSMRDIIKGIFASKVPVVIYVAPSGSRAASAGVFLAYASHIAAMAPGTNIGSAHPVQMGPGGGTLPKKKEGEERDESIMEAKIVNDAVGYIKSIAAKRGRNVEWAEAAVRESVNVTAREALELGVIDIVAEDRDELFKALEGRVVDVEGVGEVKVGVKGAEVVEVEMGFRHSILKVITNPNVAYILMLVGVVGLYFELQAPGLILPGVVGAISLILSFYAFQTLPVNYAGLALIGLAVIFFIAETQVPSFGLLAIPGVISFAIGSIMLFDSPLPYMRVSPWTVFVVTVLFSLIMLAIMAMAVRIHKRRPVSGMEGMVGDVGTVENAFTPEGDYYTGKVFVDGEYWSSTSREGIVSGSKVDVIAIKGLTLEVVAHKER